MIPTPIWLLGLDLGPDVPGLVAESLRQEMAGRAIPAAAAPNACLNNRRREILPAVVIEVSCLIDARRFPSSVTKNCAAMQEAMSLVDSR
jgi:hypothetical protein